MRNDISIRNGKIMLDGYTVYDGVNCTITATPEVQTSKCIGDKGESSRWMDMKYAGTITRRRATTWLRDKINYYLKTGKTPVFTIQGTMNDKASDYYKKNKSITTTATGCVITSDIKLLELDVTGNFLEDQINFNAYSVVTK